MSRAILCYGDSNTWGYIPGSQCSRFSWDARWPGVLQRELGRHAKVVENGVNGRTVSSSEPDKPWRNGLAHLMVSLQAHKPLDWVVVMLGTNDLKPQFNLSASQIAHHMRQLIQDIKQSGCGPDGKSPKVMVVPPPTFNPEGLENNPDFRSQAWNRPRQLKTALQQTLGDDVVVMDIPLEASPRDGVHLDQAHHDELGRKVASYFKQLMVKR